MLKAIFEILLIIVAIVIFCAAGSNTEKVQYGKDKKKSTHWSGKIRNECNTQQPQGIAISILLKLYPKINGKILGIAKFGLQSWKYSFLWFRRIPYTAEPYRR